MGNHRAGLRRGGDDLPFPLSPLFSFLFSSQLSLSTHNHIHYTRLLSTPQYSIHINHVRHCLPSKEQRSMAAYCRSWSRSECIYIGSVYLCINALYTKHVLLYLHHIVPIYVLCVTLYLVSMFSSPRSVAHSALALITSHTTRM